MKKNLGIIDKLREKNITCFKTDRFNLDNELMEPYQDDTGNYDIIKPHESMNLKEFYIDVPNRGYCNLFKYFLDGSRYTYKIADMKNADGVYMPIIAAQIGAAICARENKKIKKERLERKNIIALYSHINSEDFNEIREILEKQEINNTRFNVIKYNVQSNKTREKPENAAIAKVLKEMHTMEINLLKEMVKKRKLGSGKMLILDGSLQFVESDIDDNLFTYVIGVSKSFNPNQKGMFKSKQINIASALTQLKFGQRTPVMKHTMKASNRVIGTWYLRIRQDDKIKNPLDGIIKVEKVAVSEDEKEFGFETEDINVISRALICERNTTCHGSDKRWCNHLYPVYLTEKMLKGSFISEKFFLNIF